MEIPLAPVRQRRALLARLVRKPLVWVALLVLAAGLWFAFKPRTPSYDYTLVSASTGEVVQTVNAAGRLRAQRLVTVGAELSGLVTRVTVDFNDPVRRGQLLAEIDPTVTRAQVEQAEAQIASARAALAQGEASRLRAEAEDRLRRAEFARQQELAKSGFASKQALDSARARLDQASAEQAAARAQIAAARAELTRGQATLDRARLDLSRTTIRAPVDGVVISRRIEAGQTIASTFQTPVLFEIAEGLEQMQVEANVDEADIGAVKLGQRASFTVDAFAEERFTGTVVQVRKEPVDQNGAVTYVTVVRADNREGRLLPGMTANVEIETGRADGVLRIPTNALAFRPPRPDDAEGPVEPFEGDRLWRPNPGRPDEPLPVSVTVGLRGELFTQLKGGPVRPGDQFIARAARRAR